MKKVHSLEKGQIVVLLALALIALLAFTALAIDGGMIYADRRYMQSAADAASIAGAGAVASGFVNRDINSLTWICENTLSMDESPESPGSGITIKQYGIYWAKEKASSNGFSIDAFPAGEDGVVSVECSDSKEYVDVEVTLTHETNTSFLHLISDQPMINTVTSITKVYPGGSAGAGYAIVSLNDECHTSNDGVVISGNSNMFILNGGIYSNSCLTFNGSGADFKVIVEGVEDETKAIVYNQDLKLSGTDPEDITPFPQPINKLHSSTWGLKGVDIQCPPESEDIYEDFILHGNDEIGPGNIGKLRVTNGTVTLTGGLYCINGTVDITGGTFTIDTSGDKPKGVTIYFTGPSFTVNGGVVILAAPNTEPELIVKNVEGGKAIEDLLIYVPEGHSPDITLIGNSGSSIGGTIFAPESIIKIGGTSEVASGGEFTLTTSLIGLNVNVAGTPGMDIVYEPGSDYHWFASISVRE